MTKQERFVSCDECKPSAWKICPTCGRHRCEHKLRACHDPAKPVREGRVVTTYTGTFSTWVKDNRGSYSTQSSPDYYRRKDVALWRAAAERAGITLHVRECGSWSRQQYDWRGRPYRTDCRWQEAWIEVEVLTERNTRQAFADALQAVRQAELDAALAEDRESYNRKETIARYSGLI
jgi:hypothetical protein